MTNAELTILSFLADALVAKPKEYKELIETVRGDLERSEEFNRNLVILTGAFELHKPQSTEDVRLVKDKLSKSILVSRKRAGEILGWGFAELRGL